MTAYFILFASSFLAATVLPFYSEVVLFSMLSSNYSTSLLIAVATIGNTLGAVVNWLLGRFLLGYQDRKWFYFNPAKLEKLQRRFNRYGSWSLLLSWLPVGGDALTFIAGVMRVNFWLFLALVGIGKLSRYIGVIYLAEIFKVINILG